ncbi:MAG: hypothetical protein AYK23_02885, partial [Candidatus Proteinoplasmatales archaeon SG8-5]
SALDQIGSDQSLQEHWIKRFIAIIIDAILIYVIASIVFLFMPVPFWWGWGFGYSLMAGLLFFLYSGLMEMMSGATLGKMVLNLRVISLHGKLDVSGAVVRNISKIHGLILLIDWLVGFVTDGDPKQKFLDRVAGTTVIITDRLSDQQQHIYQSQQSDYAPPPPTQYTPHETQTYQQRGQQTAQPQQAQAPPPEQQRQKQPEGQICNDCGGRLILMGNGRLQCIRCGRIT